MPTNCNMKVTVQSMGRWWSGYLMSNDFNDGTQAGMDSYMQIHKPAKLTDARICDGWYTPILRTNNSAIFSSTDYKFHSAGSATTWLGGTTRGS